MKIVFFIAGGGNCNNDYNEEHSLILIANELEKRNHLIKIVVNGHDDNKTNKNISDKNDGVVNFGRGRMEYEYSCSLNEFYSSSIGFDLVICNYKCITEALCIRDKLSIPFIPILSIPILNTMVFPHLNFTNHNLMIPALNKLTYKREYTTHSKNEINRVNKWRNDYLELEPLKENFFERVLFDPNVQIINIFDKLLLPGGVIPSDYLDKWSTVGFICQKENPGEIKETFLSMKLISFLNLKFNEINNKYEKDIEKVGIQNKKDFPILFEFGNSSTLSNKNLILNNFKKCINLMGPNQKWIIVNNSLNKLNNCPDDNGKLLNQFDWSKHDNVILLPDQAIDQMLLLKYCSIKISHEVDIGSISSILKSGIPSIILTQNFDQPIWSKRIEQTGVGIRLDLNNNSKNNILLNSILKIQSNYDGFNNSCKEISKKLIKNSLDQSIKIIEKSINKKI